MNTRLFIAVALLLASALLGCSRGKEATKTIEVPMDDVDNQRAITRDVTLAVGNTLKVSLGSNHTTPYRWTADPKLSDPTILRQTSHEYWSPHTDRLGASGTEVWMYTALQAGTTTIVAEYAMLVGSDTTPTCTFTAKVTVH